MLSLSFSLSLPLSLFFSIHHGISIILSEEYIHIYKGEGGMALPARMVTLRRGAPCTLSCHHSFCAIQSLGRGVMILTRVALYQRTCKPPQEGAKDAAATCRAAFQHFIRLRSSEYTGTHVPTFDKTATSTAKATNGVALEDDEAEEPMRHALETIEVCPVTSNGCHTDARCTEKVERIKEKNGGRCLRSERMQPSSSSSSSSSFFFASRSVPRGKRDLCRLHQRAAKDLNMARETQLRMEYERAVNILHEIHMALKGIMPPCGGPHGSQSRRPHKEWLDSTEAIRFERLHQLRDTTSRLSTAHFLLLPVASILQFLELVGSIAALVHEPHSTAHGYVVRQAVRALFLDTAAATMNTSKGPASTSHTGNKVNSQMHLLSGLHYYKLLRVMLSLTSVETIEVSGNTGTVMPLEEFCVRQLINGVNVSVQSNLKLFLHEIGPIRAVRVVAWCMRHAASLPVSSWQGKKRPSFGASSVLPPRGELRIPFGVGKEYTQSVLASFSGYNPRGDDTSKENVTKEKARTTFGVKELAVLCNAIVFYEIRTMEAVKVLVEAAPVCAAGVEELSGHQLSCVMLAYATLRYHGELSRHPTSFHTILLSKSTNQTNFYLLLGERAGKLGEQLHEDDAARVLRALAMVDVEHEGLRRSLESSMRMKGLYRRVILS
ncbi:hypothetical protein ECC02_008215 [Trypanosoma cruzi]|uniref:Uncharacterized protein n=1 Tax=Trypanosoma cruzi TaxID=5693 RepID=A0A7J6XXW2_TRYCR|nr:hypothetical protein ECC02_008215 [Trypanosoma cruzi]